MDQDSIDIIQNSWLKIAGSEGLLVDEFYSALMAVRPDFRRFFPQTMLTQKRKFLTMIETLVNVLPHFYSFAPKLHHLGQQHSHLGLTLLDYQVFCKVFVDTLSANAKPRLSPEEAEVWLAVLDEICLMMLDSEA